jgi:hypothetical protein
MGLVAMHLSVGVLSFWFDYLYAFLRENGHCIFACMWHIVMTFSSQLSRERTRRN